MRLDRFWRIGLSILAFPFVALGSAVIMHALFGDADWAHRLFVYGVTAGCFLLLRPRRNKKEKGA